MTLIKFQLQPSFLTASRSSSFPSGRTMGPPRRRPPAAGFHQVGLEAASDRGNTGHLRRLVLQDGTAHLTSVRAALPFLPAGVVNLPQGAEAGQGLSGEGLGARGVLVQEDVMRPNESRSPCRSVVERSHREKFTSTAAWSTGSTATQDRGLPSASSPLVLPLAWRRGAGTRRKRQWRGRMSGEKRQMLGRADGVS